MDLANLTPILTFLAAVLGVVASVFPFLKKSKSTTNVVNQKKATTHSIAIVLLKKSGVTTQVVNVSADTTEVVEIKQLAAHGSAIVILKKAVIISIANILKKSSDTTERDIFKKSKNMPLGNIFNLLPYSLLNNANIKKLEDNQNIYLW